jgi:hypothetical protein
MQIIHMQFLTVSFHVDFIGVFTNEKWNKDLLF